jgi:hypothetical protein
MTDSAHHALNRALDKASPVPPMPMERIQNAAMDAFVVPKPMMGGWSVRFGALAATIVLGFGGFMALQSYQFHQKALIADADVFVEQLLSDSF